MPDYELTVLTPSNVAVYTGLDVKAIHWNDSPTREADIVRALVLRRFGGVWMDASIILTGRLPAAFEAAMGTHTFVGFYIEASTSEPQWPILENWMFACTANSPFISAWCDCFMRASDFETPAAYAAHLCSRIDTQRIRRSSQTYLLMHLAAQAVLQSATGTWDFDMRLFPAEQPGGPFALLAANAWFGLVAAGDLAKHPVRRSTIHKLRGRDRYAFTKAVLRRVGPPAVIDSIGR